MLIECKFANVSLLSKNHHFYAKITKNTIFRQMSSFFDFSKNDPCSFWWDTQNWLWFWNQTATAKMPSFVSDYSSNKSLIVHSGGLSTPLTGLLLLAYIYAIGLQELKDVAVRRNIAKDASWVRDRVKAFAIACAQGFRCKFETRTGIAIRFDARGPRGSFFCRFYRANNSNPVKSCLNIPLKIETF